MRSFENDKPKNYRVAIKKFFIFKKFALQYFVKNYEVIRTSN